MNEFNFKKKFGQNFITDTNLLLAIIRDAGIDSESEVLEIGLGMGTLTRLLSQNASKVVGVEIDKELKPYLDEVCKECTNVNIIYDDFLKQNAEKINELFSKPFSVVANLPYYITTPIIFKLLEEGFNVKDLTLMVQKEVAERICASHGTKDYGILSVMLNTFANCTIKRIVNRKMFMPVPNVDSAIIKIELCNKFNIENRVFFKKLVDTCFAMRRKTLKNNLKKLFTDDMIDNAFSALGLKADIRGEALSIGQFVELYEFFSKN